MSPFPFALPRWLLVVSICLEIVIVLAIAWWSSGRAHPEIASAASAVEFQQAAPFEIIVVDDSPPEKRKQIGEPVTFTAIVPIDPQHNFTYTWSFGKRGYQATNIYLSDGVHPLYVNVSDGSQTVQKTHMVVIAPPPPTPPTPPIPPIPPPSNLRASCITPVFANNPVSCTAAWNGDQSPTPIWNFRDDTPAERGRNVSHRYLNSGVYNVIVTLEGWPLRVDVPVTILQEPPSGLDFVALPPARAGQETTFIATVQKGSELLYDYIWGDGQMALNQRDVVSHRYERSGVYQVEVRAHNNSGSVPHQKSIRIFPQPPIPFELFNDGPKLENQPINFFVSTVGEQAVTYVWDFGDGSLPVTTLGTQVVRPPLGTVSEARIQYQYARPDKYPVYIKAINDGGQVDILDIAYINFDLPTQAITIQYEPPVIGANIPIKFTARLREGDPADFTYSWTICGASAGTNSGDSVIYYRFTQSNVMCIVSVIATPQGSGLGSVQKADLPVLVGSGLLYPFVINDGPVVQTGATLTPTPTITPTNTPASTNDGVTVDTTPTATVTPTDTSTPTATPSGTLTPANTPTPTINPIVDASPTPTAASPTPPAPAPTFTPTPLPTATHTPSPTSTPTLMPTAPPTATETPADTATPTHTPVDNGTIPPAPE